MLVFDSCVNKINYPKENDISGIATPIIIEQGQTNIILSDYFTDAGRIDSIRCKLSAVSFQLAKDKKILVINAKEFNNIPLFTNIKFWVKGFAYSIPAKRSAKSNMKIIGETLNENVDKAPLLYTDRERLGKLVISFENKPEEFFIYWQNYRIKDENIKKKQNSIEFRVPGEAGNMERSYIRGWAVNKYGVSNDILIPIFKGKIIKKALYLKRDDKQAMIMYTLLTDRFNNGNTKNDNPVKDAELSQKENYFGGDLAGLIQKIKDNYFSVLGINSICISNISQGPYDSYTEYNSLQRKYSGYQGNMPISSINIDTRFGTPDEMKQLITEAHYKDINIMMNYVFHHVHIKHPIYKQHPDWVTNVNLPDGRKNIRLFDKHRFTTWFDTFLPSLDFSKPQVVEMVSDSAMYWVENYDIDGFSDDAAKYIPDSFRRRLTQKLKKSETEEKKTIYQTGETLGSRELIGSNINSGELDGQTDFNLYFDARTVFASDNESFSKLKNSMQESLEHYGYHNLMQNITGNADIPRFISFASGSLSLDEDDKEAGWKRDIEVKDPVGYKKLSSLTAFIMTIPGVPVIYYGDEIGLPGAGDPDNRRLMKFSKLNSFESQEKKTTTQLIKLRRKNLPLIYGDIRFLEISDKTFAYARTYFDDISIVVFNKDNQKRTITFDIPSHYINYPFVSNFGSTWHVTKNSVTVTLEANSFEILSGRTLPGDDKKPEKDRHTFKKL